MDLLYTALKLLACSYLVGDQLVLASEDVSKGALPPSVVLSLESVTKYYKMILDDMGEGKAYNPDLTQATHLAKILNVIKELSHNKYMNPYAEMKDFENIIKKALDANVIDIINKFKTVMGAAGNMRLNLIQNVINTVCDKLSREECIKKAEDFFYIDINKLDPKMHDAHKDARDVLFTIDLAIRQSINDSDYNDMKEYAKTGDSKKYVLEHLSVINRLVDLWADVEHKITGLLTTKKEKINGLIWG